MGSDEWTVKWMVGTSPKQRMFEDPGAEEKARHLQQELAKDGKSSDLYHGRWQWIENRVGSELGHGTEERDEYYKRPYIQCRGCGHIMRTGEEWTKHLVRTDWTSRPCKDRSPGDRLTEAMVEQLSDERHYSRMLGGGT